jgi:hypothetical protein
MRKLEYVIRDYGYQKALYAKDEPKPIIIAWHVNDLLDLLIRAATSPVKLEVIP